MFPLAAGGALLHGCKLLHGGACLCQELGQEGYGQGECVHDTTKDMLVGYPGVINFPQIFELIGLLVDTLPWSAGL